MARQGHKQVSKRLAILRLHQLQDRVPLSTSEIYARMAAGTFPRSVPLGKRAVGWIESEIDDYIAELVEQSRKGK